MKSVGMQYLEAIRRLKLSGFQPKRSLYLSFVPDEEIGGYDGAKKLAYSDVFKDMNVEIVLDEGNEWIINWKIYNSWVFEAYVFDNMSF